VEKTSSALESNLEKYSYRDPSEYQQHHSPTVFTDTDCCITPAPRIGGPLRHVVVSAVPLSSRGAGLHIGTVRYLMNML
jgi:hypothetical protein